MFTANTSRTSAGWVPRHTLQLEWTSDGRCPWSSTPGTVSIVAGVICKIGNISLGATSTEHSETPGLSAAPLE